MQTILKSSKRKNWWNKFYHLVSLFINSIPQNGALMVSFCFFSRKWFSSAPEFPGNSDFQMFCFWFSLPGKCPFRRKPSGFRLLSGFQKRSFRREQFLHNYFCEWRWPDFPLKAKCRLLLSVSEFSGICLRGNADFHKCFLLFFCSDSGG